MKTLLIGLIFYIILKLYLVTSRIVDLVPSKLLDLSLLTSQVEHTKKHSSIDSENKYVERNSSHQFHLTVCVTVYLSPQYYYAVKKHFGSNRLLWHEVLTDQVCVK